MINLAHIYCKSYPFFCHEHVWYAGTNLNLRQTCHHTVHIWSLSSFREQYWHVSSSHCYLWPHNHIGHISLPSLNKSVFSATEHLLKSIEIQDCNQCWLLFSVTANAGCLYCLGRQKTAVLWVFLPMRIGNKSGENCFNLLCPRVTIIWVKALFIHSSATTSHKTEEWGQALIQLTNTINNFIILALFK